MKTLGESDNNAVVQVNVATTFSLSLAENGTTGHKWTTPTFDRGILSLQSDVTNSPATDAPPGAGGSRNFVFRANAAGTTKIELAYRRSWEAVSESTTSYAVTVVVKE